MTPVDWSDPLRAEAMRHCTEGRGPMVILKNPDFWAIAKAIGAALFLTFVAAAAVVMLV